MNYKCLILIAFHVYSAFCSSNEKIMDEMQRSFFEYLLKENPEFASKIGDKRYDDQVDDYSLETFDRWKAKAEEVLVKLNKIPRDTLSDELKTDFDIFKSFLQTYLDGYKWRMYSALTPVNIMARPASLNSRTVDRITLSNKRDFVNFITRIRKYPNQIAQIKTRMKKAVELKTTFHKVSMATVPRILSGLTGETPEECFLYRPFKTILNNMTTISDNDKVSLRLNATSAIGRYVEAVEDLKNFVTNVYLNNTRPGLGVNSWPDGESFYKETLFYRLSVNLTAAEINRIGIQEVDRISREMKKIFDKMGIHGSIKESFDVLRKDKQYFLDTGNDMVEKYTDIIQNDIEPKLSEIFAERPDIPVIVKPTETDGVFASYSTPPADGSKPGIFNLNTFHPDESPWYGYMAIALHETNPGHHLQLTTAITSDIPQIRRDRLTTLYFQIPTAFPTWNAYIEGWGLYAEYLGEEMGLYKTDVEMLGRYSLEIFRACRLVVDTGLHHFNWTRERAIEYLTNYTSLGSNDISFEVNRYVTIPGQALAYKIGEIKFKELRRRAEDRLGEKFDLKGFHKTVLRNGPMSFTNLQKVVDRWISAVKSSSSGACLIYATPIVSLVTLVIILMNV